MNDKIHEEIKKATDENFSNIQNKLSVATIVFLSSLALCFGFSFFKDASVAENLINIFKIGMTVTVLSTSASFTYAFYLMYRCQKQNRQDIERIYEEHEEDIFTYPDEVQLTTELTPEEEITEEKTESLNDNYPLYLRAKDIYDAIMCSGIELETMDYFVLNDILSGCYDELLNDYYSMCLTDMEKHVQEALLQDDDYPRAIHFE